jgi:hypothetical protein
MEFHNTTRVNQAANDAINSFKYNPGRDLAFVFAILLIGGGAGLCFLQGFFIVPGALFIFAGLLFLYAFTLGWKRTLAKLIASERSKHPITREADLVYSFKEDAMNVALEVPGRTTQEESHPYSDFVKMDITENYLFLSYGNVKKNPAFPVKYTPDLLAFLQTKITKVKDHRPRSKA